MSSKNSGLEFQFVESWEAWDEIETFCLQFYNCPLKQDVAEQVGFGHAAIVILSADDCVVQFMETDDSEPVEFTFIAKLLRTE